MPKHPEVIVGTQVNATDAERAPPGTPKTQRHEELRTFDETPSARIRSFFNLQASWQLEEYIDPLSPVTRPEPNRDVEQLALEGPFAAELDLYFDAWRAHLQRTDCCNQCKGCGEQDQLRQTQHKCGQKAQSRQSGVRA
ncbi:MAG: hypothetical protein ACXW0F_04930 [Gaiellaceae bacterium]